jgi:hypothetical protein
MKPLGHVQPYLKVEKPFGASPEIERLVHELNDRFGTISEYLATVLGHQGRTPTFFSPTDHQGTRITNVGRAQEPTDAVTLQDLIDALEGKGITTSGYVAPDRASSGTTYGLPSDLKYNHDHDHLYVALNASNQPNWKPVPTMVENLNADLLDGYHANEILGGLVPTDCLKLNGTNQADWTPTNDRVSNLNADMLDGLHAAAFSLTSHDHDFTARYLRLDGVNHSSWTPPTTKVEGLNADLLDGLHSTYFSPAGHVHNYSGHYLQLNGANQNYWMPTTALVANLNADMVDGLHASELGGLGGETDHLTDPISSTTFTLSYDEEGGVQLLTGSAGFMAFVPAEQGRVVVINPSEEGRISMLLAGTDVFGEPEDPGPPVTGVFGVVMGSSYGFLNGIVGDSGAVMMDIDFTAGPGKYFMLASPPVAELFSVPVLGFRGADGSYLMYLSTDGVLSSGTFGFMLGGNPTQIFLKTIRQRKRTPFA